MVHALRVGKIKPHRFGRDEALAAAVSVSRAEAEAMAQAAQRLWDAIRQADLATIQRLSEVSAELGEAAMAVREAMR